MLSKIMSLGLQGEISNFWQNLFEDDEPEYYYYWKVENSQHCHSVACSHFWCFSKKLLAGEDCIPLTVLHFAFSSVSRKTCTYMTVFNGFIDKLHVFMQSMNFFRAVHSLGFTVTLSNNKNLHPCGESFCTLSLELPQWHKFSIWQAVLHMKDYSNSIAARVKLCQHASCEDSGALFNWLSQVRWYSWPVWMSYLLSPPYF